MAKRLTDLQQAAFEVIDANRKGDADFAIERLEEVLRATLATKPVGRPRTRVHDETKANCSCSDCRKARKEAKGRQIDILGPLTYF